MFKDTTFQFSTTTRQYTIILNARLNLILDNSGTGKTTLYRDIIAYKPNNICTFTDLLYTQDIISSTGSLIVVDEDDLAQLTSENLNKFLNTSQNIILVIARHTHLLDKMHYRAVYNLVATTPNHYILSHTYPS